MSLRAMHPIGCLPRVTSQMLAWRLPMERPSRSPRDSNQVDILISDKGSHLSWSMEVRLSVGG